MHTDWLIRVLYFWKHIFYSPISIRVVSLEILELVQTLCALFKKIAPLHEVQAFEEPISDSCSQEPKTKHDYGVRVIQVSL